MGRPKGSVSWKTGDLILAAKDAIRGNELAPSIPWTLRQVFYSLVSSKVIKENTEKKYKALGKALVAARKQGTIPWDWIEDRTRKPRFVSMWNGVGNFGRSVVSQYRLNVWINQPRYTEVWLEKEALSGIFEDILDPYGVTLNVGRGYDGWSSIKDAAKRYHRKNQEGKDVTVLYFGDFDPQGVDIPRSLEERLKYFGCELKLEIIALKSEDIQTFNLPQAMVKDSTLKDRFVEEQGTDMTVELDALPARVLVDRLRNSVETHMDMDLLADTKNEETGHIRKLKSIFGVSI